MYRLDKTYSKAKTFSDAEKDNIFPATVSCTERLSQAWYLTAMAFGIDPFAPPKMNKQIISVRKRKK